MFSHRGHLSVDFTILSVAAVALLLSGGKSYAGFLAKYELFSRATRAAPTSDSVLSDVIQLQRDEGLTIAFYDHTLSAVSFNQRSTIKSVKLPFLMPNLPGAVSSDGMQVAGNVPGRSGRLILGIVRFDGSDPRNYEGIVPGDFCWSHDNGSIALTNAQGPTANMEVVNVSTNATQIIQANVEKRWHFTSQCWSPDDKQIVFENGGSIQIYDSTSDKIRDLVKGTKPTWSPDGEWIAFLDHETYYAIRPTGEDKRKLFHKKNVTSGLYWSPDSRIVAYVSLASVLEGGIAETYRLRFRRLKDNSEDSVAGVSCCVNFQWVKNAELLKYVSSPSVP
jgi:hypothetical protein